MINRFSGTLLCLSVLTLTGFVSAAGETIAAPPRARVLKVLIFTGGHEFDHSEFLQMFDGHPDIQWTEARYPEAADWLTPEKAGNYDVLVWYQFGQPAPSEQQARQIQTLFEQGMPLLVLHHAIIAYNDWPELKQIVGGTYHVQASDDHPASTFKHDQKMNIRIADEQHAITRFMNDFELHDETYGNVEILPGVRPLLITDHPESNDLVGWTHTYKNSPVVYLQPGHDAYTYRNRQYQRLLIQSIRWLGNLLPDPSDEGFESIFNGRNFDGWTIMGKEEGFTIRDGVIRSEAGAGGNWMRTNRTYDNFVLRVDWKVGPVGNAGIFVRSQEQGAPWETGSEVQISNEYRDAAHCTGSLYGSTPADPRPDERPDIWHQFEIQCRGPHYTVYADNVPVVDVDARQVPELGRRPMTGYIGLQDSHNRTGSIEYRNLRIKELPMSSGAEAWQLGTQAFTFHRFTLFETMEKAQKLGLHYIELFPGQALSPEQKDVRFDHHASMEVREQVKRKLREYGLTPVSYGVVGIDDNEEEARSIFAFAKDMGMQTVVSEPQDKPEVWEMLDKLTQEYELNLAIHNHPQPSHYWNPDTVLRAIKDLNPRIGACADTGHWMRSGVDPMEAIKKLEGRIIEFHFKDLNKRAPDGHDVPWGSGKLDARAILTQLDKQGFSGFFAIEYEHNWLESMPEIAKAIEFFRQVKQELAESDQ